MGFQTRRVPLLRNSLPILGSYKERLLIPQMLTTLCEPFLFAREIRCWRIIDQVISQVQKSPSGCWLQRYHGVHSHLYSNFGISYIHSPWLRHSTRCGVYVFCIDFEVLTVSNSYHAPLMNLIVWKARGILVVKPTLLAHLVGTPSISTKGRILFIECWLIL